MNNKIELYKEVTKARSTINNADKKLADINYKILLNIEYEKAGDIAPYDYKALHEEAQALRAEASAAPEALTDNAALLATNIFPTLKGNGALVKAGIRINYNGKLYRAKADLWDYTEYNPEAASALWELVTYTNGIRDIPEVITASAAFAKGELGYWKGATYESLIDNNVWTPEAYSAGWKLKG